jgi:hypothetical protein
VGSLGPTTLAPSGAFTAVVTGRRVEIPNRIYHAVPGPETRSVLTARQLLILDCLLTRHHDGFVRQRAASRILPADRPWVAPFVVHLIGEYVVEIVAAIAAELAVGDVRLALYRGFARENQGLIALVRARDQLLELLLPPRLAVLRRLSGTGPA